MPDPRADLHAALQRYDRRVEVLERRSRRLSRVRLAVVLVGGAAAFAVGDAAGAGAGWGVALAVALGFRWLAGVHDRVEGARARVRRWRLVQARHLARLDLDWDALPAAPPPAAPEHPFAADLDLAGPRSVLHLLDATATVGGSARLRSWLLAPEPDPPAAVLRQERVLALRSRRRLRDRLALLGLEAAGDPDGRWDDAPVRAWLAAPEPDAALRAWAWGLSALAAATAALVLLALLGGPSLWGYAFLLYAALYLSRYARYATVFDRAYDLQRALLEVEPALRWLERDPARADPALAPLWVPFAGEAAPARQFGRLRRIASAAAVTRNEFGRIVLNALLPYDLLLSLALVRLRGTFAARLPGWLDAYYEVEALGALAAYADFRRDAVTVPDLDTSGRGGAVFEATSLRHPLLQAEQAVGNDIALGTGGVVIVTGSNMSGKSTFLRAVGVATVLAWAGGAVPASRLRLGPLRPFTSMRVGDVLQEGLSTFYAEVRRLRALLDAVEAGGPPALVLIDEMLRGTNNRERLAGAQAIVRALAGAGATSLVATHDLGLTELAGASRAITNAHFREEAEGDRLAFDYRLRPGPCPTTNALVIMRRAGLPVPERAPGYDGGGDPKAAPAPVRR